MAQLYTLQNFKTDTLASDITSGATSATLSTGNFSADTNAVLVLDYDIAAKREIVSCSISGTSITSMVRGLGGTSAVTHSQNAKVMMGVTSLHYEALKNNHYTAAVSGSNISIGSNNTYTDGASVSVTATGRPFLVGFTAHITNASAANSLASGQLVCDGTAIPSSADSLESYVGSNSFDDHAVISYTTIWNPSGTGSKTVKFQAKGRNNGANFTGSIITGSNVWALEL